ncbi:Protein of unknown function [Micromonospora phaseoli]|uniref:DUF4012 domain-containing protein n=1 Tax=Micromonospora phaseoli TaxID=1144548 RepID=A0A1H6YTE1_9ACTN|nr:DUF4012 domain-containing protein [Micromonospora phaseoli]PZW00340.1 uncharacterized protein DUF4012 [Micromonospora phaseoli]GIJ76818.1 hypothetical protein Xph01_12500 [Micromonospora phaseoli]SEJ43616.1 Protein of unknown function [Micromonospora phaseoli]
MTESESPRRRRSRARRRRRARLRRALLTTLVVSSLLLGLAGWVGFRAWQARGHLVNAAGLAGELSAHLVGGDTARAQRTLAALQEQSGAARRATGDPGWWLGRQVPAAGANFSVVRQIAVAIDDLARQAFPALLRVDLGGLVPREGRLDLTGLRAVTDDLVAVDATVQRTRTDLAGIPGDRLAGQVRRGLEELRGEIDKLAAMTSAADRASRLLPPLLGVDGPRRYLLVSQNSAELRATGGMFGAYAVIEAEKGRIKMGAQGSSSNLGHFVTPLKIPAEQRALWGELPGIYPADVNLSPHFPTAASLYREMYRRYSDETVDGVLAVDPVMLSYLLQATGPVRVPGGVSLSAENVVRTLLSDAYQRMSPKEQDGFFAAAAATVFDTLFSRNVHPNGLLSAFDRSIREGRILFWSARPEEQRMFGDSRMAGTLPEQDTVPTVGVFLNDGSGAKLGYYLRQTADLVVGDCHADGRRELNLRVTLRSTAPASGLSESVLGLAQAGDPYTVRTLVSVYGPAGGAVLDTRLDGAETSVGNGTERRRQVATVNVEVGPGGIRTLEVSLLTGKTDSGAADLWLTPTATPWTTHVVTAPSCSQ